MPCVPSYCLWREREVCSLPFWEPVAFDEPHWSVAQQCKPAARCEDRSTVKSSHSPQGMRQLAAANPLEPQCGFGVWNGPQGGVSPLRHFQGRVTPWQAR